MRNDAKSSIHQERTPASSDSFFDLTGDLVHSDNPESNDSYIERQRLFGLGHPIRSLKP
jgi:hypothetical protein